MRLRYRLEHRAYHSAAALLRWLPLRVANAAASLVGCVAFVSGGKRSRAARENLRIAFPELSPLSRAALGLRSFRHFAWNVVDFARSEIWSASEVERHVSLEGTGNLQSALAEGRGVIILTLHLGNFELGAQAIALAGFKPLVIGRPFPNPLTYGHLVASLTRFGAELIDREGAAPRMLRKLRRNEVVLVMNDQYVRPAYGIFVPFFGVRASTSAGVATLAARTGAAVCPAYTVRHDDGKHTAWVLPALEFRKTSDRKRDIARATAGYNAVLEGIIREYPEQWMWGHRRFRHSPDLR